MLTTLDDIGATRRVPYIRLFEDMARARPSAVAAEDAVRRATYAELDGMAERFAHEMRERDVGRGAIVAIARDRDVFTLAAILATFKCGAAYLPIDPEAPTQRRRQMLARCACTLVLADARAKTACETDAGHAVTAIDLADWVVLGPRPQGARSDARLDDPAYVIFTSGSTGTPKGAVLSQANLVNHLWAKVDALGLAASDRIAQTAPFAFDLSVWQFLVAGLVGGSVTFVAQDVVADPPALLDTLARANVTVAQAVPSYLNMLLDVVRRRDARLTDTLRVMVTAGETLPIAVARRWFEASGARLVNAYGPTECGVDVTHHAMACAPDGHTVPIGRAIPGAELHVVNAALERVADGEAGELLIGGVATGLGYVGAPEQTAAAFVELPFARGRCYRTGDRVSRRGDVYTFLGRLDLQIKLRGYRIEPEEIEAVLLRDPRVRAAAVTLYRDGARAELVAVMERAEPDGSLDALRHACRERLAAALPAYMVPRLIEFVYAMPLNARGKTDRGAIATLLRALNPFQ
ncbi:amino acid adenylation domain-containing protein [Burkholderia sola]|uniref:amino acid adenylation domain-containing protein n=1 Tax=Burkholderia TaxID=32008 RepID=UPI001AE24AD9|nr:amino acid adenylation domain-containing protein [Burkholderia sp. AcTa6-5]MBP0713546.1 amino acid adenylation domain-containing protein [Burkholderia sp. AcTa6-5]